MAESKQLPGWPKARLVKDVRQTLWRNMRCRPRADDTAWRAAWQWAYDIAKSYVYRTMWPTAREIASQYLYLQLAQMQQANQLKLPHRAGTHCPASVRSLIGLPPPSTAGEAATQLSLPFHSTFAATT